MRDVKNVDIDIANLVVTKGLVAQKNTKIPQVIQISVTTADIGSGVADITWQNLHSDGGADEPFATANLYYGNPEYWLRSWIPATHLIQGRIEALQALAEQGIANRFSRNMAYRLFASNLVDYAEKYRGIQTVVLHELEAFADIVLTTEKAGTWTIPPHFIDSVAHLAGFVMNVSDAVDTSANFFVTPGWDSMRFARPLVPGAAYRSYVKMIATKEDSSVYLGDVYILQDDAIVGFVGSIKFRQYPRILLDRFFSAPDAGVAQNHTTLPKPTPHVAPQPLPKEPAKIQAAAPPVSQAPATANEEPKATLLANSVDTAAVSAPDSTASKALTLIAEETGIDLADITEDASFANLGVDSLMSLVIAEKFRSLLGVTVAGSLFLEYPTVGDLKAWLLEYYD